MNIFYQIRNINSSISRPACNISTALFTLSLCFIAMSASAQVNSSAPGAAIGASSAIATVLPAVLSVTGVVISAVISAVLAFWIARINSANAVRLARDAAVDELNADLRKRHSELAFSIASAIEGNPELARRFAVGIVKVVKDNTPGGKNIGKILFIPFNSRVTIGRDQGNDLVLSDEGSHISRWHCGFVSDGDEVYIEDFSAINATEVNNTLIGGDGKLTDGDHINVSECVLKFQVVRRHERLSMAGAIISRTGKS